MLTRFAIIQFARADVGQCLAVTFEGTERAGLVVLSADLHLVADDRIADMRLLSAWTRRKSLSNSEDRVCHIRYHLLLSRDSVNLACVPLQIPN